jgi:sugar phosphate isomerase/epimerase
METFSYHLAFAAGRMDIRGFIRRCAEFGLEGVQLNMGHFGPLLRGTPTAAREVREMTTGYGMFVEVDTRGTDPAHLTEMLNLCKAVGADVLRTYASCGGELTRELEQAPRDLRAVVPLCRDMGIRIAVENHEYETSLDVLRIVQEVGSEWVGTHIDTGNSMMVWEEPVTAVRTLAPFAVSSHFKDHIVVVEHGIPLVVGVALGTGSSNCPECYRIIAEESPLDRLIIEVCYGYSAPFRRPQDQGAGGRLGTGAFRVVDGPLDPAWAMPHPQRASRADQDRLLAWQEEAVVRSVAYVQKLNEALR